MAVLCSITSSTRSGCWSEKYAPMLYRLVSMRDSRNESRSGAAHLVDGPADRLDCASTRTADRPTESVGRAPHAFTGVADHASGAVRRAADDSAGGARDRAALAGGAPQARAQVAERPPRGTC